MTGIILTLAAIRQRCLKMTFKQDELEEIVNKLFETKEILLEVNSDINCLAGVEDKRINSVICKIESIIDIVWK